MAGLSFTRLVKNKFLFSLLVALSLIPGIAFMSVYVNKDVRAQASEWIYTNVPQGSSILSETANVVDLPLQINNFYQDYNYVSFNFYDLQEDENLQLELRGHLQNADYIFVPSRRIFMNLSEEDVLLREYYLKLNDGSLGFTKVAEFNSYPRIKLSGETLLEFPDEGAEETFTVFDHPVIRIYKRK